MAISDCLQYLKPFIPKKTWFFVKDFTYRMGKLRWKLRYRSFRKQQLIRAQQVQKKETINVLFEIHNFAKWKTVDLYHLMEEHPRFRPALMVTTKDGTKRDELCSRLQQMNCKILQANNIVEARQEFAPDILFIQEPYEDIWYGHKREEEPELMCYVPYSFQNSVLPDTFDNIRQNKCWFNFVECKAIADIAKALMFNKGENVYISGYPPIDDLLFPKTTQENCWKAGKENRKKIIYAPHWSINAGETPFDFSTFLKLADPMLEIAKRFADSCQFAFKPHPLLYDALLRHPQWGKKRTDDYYAAWESQENTQLALGGYIDLFLQSDAIIHDSCSFIFEYLCTGKPCMYLRKKETLEPLNSLTQEAISCYYQASDSSDVETFLNDIVLKGNDTMQPRRLQFRQDNLMPPNNISSSQFILNTLLGLPADNHS